MLAVIKAEKREKFGSSEAKKIKRNGYIPAIIYSKDGHNININVNGREFEKEYLKNTILSSIIELDFNDKKTKVIAHKVDIDPVTDRPIHIDFLRCEVSSPIIAKPRIVFTNKDKSPGLKKGGILHIVMRRLEVKCESKSIIPHTVEIDVGATHLGNKIRAVDVILPTNLSFVKKDNFLICSIIGRGKSEEEVAAATGITAPIAGTTPTANTPAAPATKETIITKDKK